SWLIRLACSAVLVGAHYREPRRDDKGNFAKIGIFLAFSSSNAYLSNKKPRNCRAQAIQDDGLLSF
ncbi:hypothetical protein, partial [Aeromonas hydrophila]|uniref:hypothetical protein n=1 Tax=Aeromonas hydrophila TaxID=644 RepID=UPI0036D7F6E1